MATIEFSDGFDAVGWYMDQMSKGRFQDEYECEWEAEQQLAYWD